jgi:hypothetical protein
MGEVMLSESVFCYPRVNLAIRQYLWLSASVSGYRYKLTTTIEIQSLKKNLLSYNLRIFI